MSEAVSTSELEQVKAWVSMRVQRLVRDPQEREEVVAIVLSDYWKYRRRRPVDDGDAEPGNGMGLAAQIVRWRVADHYRSRVKIEARDVGAPNPETLGSGAPSAYRAALHAELLRDILHAMRKLPERDRSLLLRDALTDAPELALTTAERRQLSRLRKRLVERVETRYGETLPTLMRDEDFDDDRPD